jgi:hypothetical protein
MDLGHNLGHLTYSTLVHPGDTWEQMWTSLTTYVPQVKQRVAPEQPFGLSLRLSAASARTLASSPDERARLKEFLADEDHYLYTVNAFIDVADVLAELGAEGTAPSIQSPPLGFKPRVTGPDVVQSYTEHVLRVVAHLVVIEQRTGRTVSLALEPEPYCFLETTGETVDYFQQRLYSGDSAAALARLAGIPISDAHAALRRHLGVVFDICHQAVEYEDIPDSLRRLVDAGIPILKLQEAAAIHVPEVTEEAVDTLERYAETIYLTQTLERANGSDIIYHLNVQDAIAAWRADPGPGREWRVHIHVPVFLDDLGPFGTTRSAIAEALAVHKASPLSAQLEIETYTWDMLPDDLKTGDIVEYVTRELEWVRGQLT